MINHIFFYAFDRHILQLVLSLFQRVLYQKFMEGTVFGCVFEDPLLFEHRHSHQIMKLHQHSSMSNCKDSGLLRRFFQFVMNDVVFNKKLQKLETPSIDINPAFPFVAFVFPNCLFLFVGLLLPSRQRLTFKNASTFLPYERSQGYRDLFQIFGHTFDVLKGIHSPSQIGDVDMIKTGILLHKPSTNLLGLLSSQLSQNSGLLATDHPFDIIFSLSMPGKKQANRSFIFLHFMTILKLLVDMIDRVQQVNGKEIYIAQDLSLSHAGTVWDGAIVMLHYWNKNKNIAKSLFKGKRVLEVGSGTGIVGIAASAFGPNKVYLTDLPQYLGILQSNKNKNLSLNENIQCLQVRRLQWGNKQDISQITQIDTLIGSQLAYDKHHVIQLMQTIKHYKTVNPKLTLMISFQNYKEEWKNLRVKFTQFFGQENFSLVSWGQFDEEYRDQNIGILYFNNLLEPQL